MEIEPLNLQQILAAAHAQVAAALWLSAGMLCATATILCSAAGWRKAALAWGFLYSGTLCFVHNGHAQILGPVGCAAAAVGWFWPVKNRSS
jgi:hypothetical protein